MINVTKPYFPPIDEYIFHVNKIWENEWLTNRGKLTLELEEKLKNYLKLKNILILNNGTIPLQIALKLLARNGEVITTPFSYIATTSSILWENCKPVFVDIDPDYLTIDEKKIEKKITKNTSAILATHVFGNACNVEVIRAISEKYDLKIIYDAAHCFGVRYKDKSIFEFGDISTCSFHATKLFHTGEGGAIFSNDTELMEKIFYSHNFGHKSPTDFAGIGINGKISELQAALGLSVLPYIDKIIERRKQIIDIYESKIKKNNFSFMKLRDGITWNYSYYPIIFRSERQLLKSLSVLNQAKIYPRRYFYPSLNTLPFVNGDICEVSEQISKSILCLPISYDLKDEEVEKIIDLLNLTLI